MEFRMDYMKIKIDLDLMVKDELIYQLDFRE